jgi:flagellar motility protein MotE (MotC chaperone)
MTGVKSKARTPRKRGNKTEGLIETVVPPSVGPLRRINLDDLKAVRRECARVYRAVRLGHLAPEVGTRLAYLLQTLGKLHEAANLEERLAALEGRIAAAPVPLIEHQDDSDDQLAPLPHAVEQAREGGE